MKPVVVWTNLGIYRASWGQLQKFINSLSFQCMENILPLVGSTALCELHTNLIFSSFWRANCFSYFLEHLEVLLFRMFINRCYSS